MLIVRRQSDYIKYTRTTLDKRKQYTQVAFVGVLLCKSLFLLHGSTHTQEMKHIKLTLYPLMATIVAI